MPAPAPDVIHLEGPLFVPDLLWKFLDGQFDRDPAFAPDLPPGLRASGEIDRSFAIASAAWRQYKARRAKNPRTARETFLRSLFHDALGHSSAPLPADALPFRLPASVPVFVKDWNTGPDDRFDAPSRRFSGDGLPERRRSVSQFVQQWLNHRDDALWAVATDGRTIRLLRDNASLTRPAWVEIDLERILEEGRYTDFARLWRLLRFDRAGSSGDGRDSVWEKLRDKGTEEGVRVFENLRDGVVRALLLLGNGFLRDPSVREAYSAGALTDAGFFQELLRVAYRFLFLFSAEERHALHPEAATGTPAAEAYDRGYSMRRLVDRCRRPSARDSYTDVWDGIRIVFRSLARGEERLALPALGGLFHEGTTPHLDVARISNRDLLLAIHALRWTRVDNAERRVDYHNLGSEELGSVYESLLELVPSVTVAGWHFSFVGIPDPFAETAPVRRRQGRAGSNQAGNARKTTGSYYTPTALVEELVRSTLPESFFDARLKGLKTPEEREEALLSLAVVDPACGSGHFLLAAARRIAERLAQVRTGDEDVVTPEAYRAALRDVVSRCLYGVDLNPMAIELAKIALWIETLDPGRPLTFLDSHFVCGNSVLGISDLSQLRQGISEEAYVKKTSKGDDAYAGDDLAVATALKLSNRAGLAELAVFLRSAPLFATLDESLATARTTVEALPSSTIPEVEAKSAALAVCQDLLSDHPLYKAADYYVAAFLIEKKDPTAEYPVTARLTGLLASDPLKAPSPAGLEAATTVARAARALHWPLVFPEVFARGGFDCVLANPPWNKISIKAKEFFAYRYPAIASTEKADKRNRLIAALRTGTPAEQKLVEAFDAALSDSIRQSTFVHAKRLKKDGEAASDVPSVRFPLTGIGDVNLYALFSELTLQILRPEGRAGFVVPTGICTDKSTTKYFNYLTSTKRLESIHDFENRARLFPSVDSRFKFSLLTLGAADRADLAFFLTDPAQLADERRHFSLSPDEFALLNPNTRTCPVCRTGRDAELLKKIHRRVGVLLRDSEVDDVGANPWGVEYATLFHMTSDSRLFLDAPEEGSLPLYEAKMVHLFDHRWATFEEPAGGAAASAASEESSDDEEEDEGGGKGPWNATPEQKANPAWEPRPRYWVTRHDTFIRLADIPPPLFRAAKSWNLPKMRAALANWALLSFPDPLVRAPEDTLADLLGEAFVAVLPSNWQAKTFNPATRTPLLREQLAGADAEDFFDRLLEARMPSYLFGYRGITNATNARSVITAIIPTSAAGNSFVLCMPGQSPALNACFLGDVSSLVHDWCARQKLGGTNLNTFYVSQIATLSPAAYTQADVDFIVPRVLELTYTSHSLKPWAEALGCSDGPFPWNEERRAVLRAELDAHYARLYGLDRDELRYILDPKEAMADPDFPSESFRVLKDDEVSRFNEFRTARLVLEAWDRENAR